MNKPGNGAGKLALFVVAAVLGLLILAGGGVVEHGRQITANETRIDGLSEALGRIETKLDRLLEK